MGGVAIKVKGCVLYAGYDILKTVNAEKQYKTSFDGIINCLGRYRMEGAYGW